MRRETKIKGLNKILKGELEEGEVVLLKGPPATGKTILSLYFKSRI